MSQKDSFQVFETNWQLNTEQSIQKKLAWQSNDSKKDFVQLFQKKGGKVVNGTLRSSSGPNQMAPIRILSSYLKNTDR